MANRGCYRFSTRHYTEGILDATVDATYILHLEGNGRMPNIERQLRDIHPTRTLHILHNAGYKKCQKQLKQQSSVYDLMDGMITIMRHAIEQGYSTILLLEDDFIFSSALLEKKTIADVNTFLQQHAKEDMIYQLGAIPIIRVPYRDTTNRSLGGGAHANVYSKSAIERLIAEYDADKIQGHIDLHHIVTSMKTHGLYMYHKPLVYQTMPMTENRKEWFADGILSKGVELATNTFISATGLDESPEPGTSILYFISLIAFVVIMMAVFGAAFVVYSYRGALVAAMKRVGGARR